MKDRPTVLAFHQCHGRSGGPVHRRKHRQGRPPAARSRRPITIINASRSRVEGPSTWSSSRQQANVAVVRGPRPHHPPRSGRDRPPGRARGRAGRVGAHPNGPWARSSKGLRTPLGQRRTSARDAQGVVPNFAKLNVDADSNQIVVAGNIGLLQRLERLITALDQPNAASLVAGTFQRATPTPPPSPPTSATSSPAGQRPGRQPLGSSPRIFRRAATRNQQQPQCRNNSSATTSQGTSASRPTRSRTR